MKHPQPGAASQADFKASSAQTACWPIQTLHWIPPSQQGSSPWIVCTRRVTSKEAVNCPSAAPALQSWERHALFCQDTQGNTCEVVVGDLRPTFRIGLLWPSPNQPHLHAQSDVCMAACWGHIAGALVLYELPSLQTCFTFREANCTIRPWDENAVQIGPHLSKLAIWWGDNALSMLAVYDTGSGKKLATFSDRLQGPTRMYYQHLLVWSPCSDRLLCTRTGSYYVLELLTGHGFHIWIRPRPSFELRDATVQCGWMPCGQAVLVMGQQTWQGQSHAGHNQVSLFAVHMDVSIMSEWPCVAGWQTVHQAHICQESQVNHPSWRRANLAAWELSQHPLEPTLSQGIAGLLQPHDHLTALISSHVDSQLGLDFQTFDGCRGWTWHSYPSDTCTTSLQATTPKLSPNGKLLVLAPVVAELLGRAQLASNPAYGQHCAHLVWDAAQQKIKRQVTTWPAWTCFAWHPAAIFTSLYASSR